MQHVNSGCRFPRNYRQRKKLAMHLTPHHIVVACEILGSRRAWHAGKTAVSEPRFINFFLVLAVVPINAKPAWIVVRAESRCGADGQLMSGHSQGLTAAVLQSNRGGEKIIGFEDKLLQHPQAIGESFFRAD